MRCHHVILGLAVGLLSIPSAAWAILIETPTGRVAGFFESDDSKTLVIRVIQPDGTEKKTPFERSKIKIKIIHQLNKARLEKLNKDDPKAYRDYADELAAQKADPEAKLMARRLYLFAAYLNPDQYGYSSLVAMSSLAETRMEARKCLAKAYLLDAKGDANVLNRDTDRTPQLGKAQASALHEFQKALQAYRTGQIKVAIAAATPAAMDKVFGQAPGMMDQKTFLARCADAKCTTCQGYGKVRCSGCNGKGKVADMGAFFLCQTCNGQKNLNCTACEMTGVTQTFSDDTLRTLLRAELWAIDQLAGREAGDKKNAGETKWSTILQARQVSPVTPLSWETITEINPKNCVYRNGDWIESAP